MEQPIAAHDLPRGVPVRTTLRDESMVVGDVRVSVDLNHRSGQVRSGKVEGKKCVCGFFEMRRGGR